jgi:hypothetical protein
MPNKYIGVILRRHRRAVDQNYADLVDLLHSEVHRLSRRLHNHKITFMDAMGSTSVYAESIHTGKRLELTPDKVDKNGTLFYVAEMEPIDEILEAMREVFSGSSGEYIKSFRGEQQ